MPKNVLGTGETSTKTDLKSQMSIFIVEVLITNQESNWQSIGVPEFWLGLALHFD